MLKKIIYITFFVFNYSYSQSIKEFKLLSEIDSTSIEYAHIIIDGKLKTYSNEKLNWIPLYLGKSENMKKRIMIYLYMIII